jgi:hypothetical protein
MAPDGVATASARRRVSPARCPGPRAARGQKRCQEPFFAIRPRVGLPSKTTCRVGSKMLPWHNEPACQDIRRTPARCPTDGADHGALDRRSDRVLGAAWPCDRTIARRLAGAGPTTGRRGGVPLSECLASVDSAAGRRRVAEYLESRPFPHYEPVPGLPGLLARVDADGRRTLGRFVGREFRAVPCP